MNNFPTDFDFNLYKLFYTDLRHFSDNDLRIHYLDFGKEEGRMYKLPYNFDIIAYKQLNEDLRHLNDDELKIHYVHNGIHEKRQYNFSKINSSNLASREHIVFVIARYNEDLSNFMKLLISLLFIF